MHGGCCISSHALSDLAECCTGCRRNLFITTRRHEPESKQDRVCLYVGKGHWGKKEIGVEDETDSGFASPAFWARRFPVFAH